jgi:biopolymer transport protein ExbD
MRRGCWIAARERKSEAPFRAQLRQGCERKVYMRGEARTRYHSVEKVLDAMRSDGLESVALVVEQRRFSLSN